MRYSLGLDVGSVRVKLALLCDGEIVHLDSERITSSPRDAVAALINRASGSYSLEDITSAAVSGSGSAVIPGELGWAEYSSSLAIASGLLLHHPEAKTIVQIGGQSSFVISLQDGLRKPWHVVSNSLCAAGTGRFIEQQAYRIGIGLDDFSRIALDCEGNPPRIAARCSVFAKSDLIHLQQKGVPMSGMLYALSESIARMVGSLKKGSFDEPVFFVGGVAANAAVRRALNESVSARNGHAVEVEVPEHFLHIEAIGCATLAADSGRSSRVVILPEESLGQRYYEMSRLEKVEQRDAWSATDVTEPFVGYLGVDIGSTSTKAVILDESGAEVVAKSYLMTAGRPVEAIKDVFRNLLGDVGEKATIAGVGVTGSGRYLVGSFIGADVIRNEITAQTRAAADVDPDADIIEIGGQDSKLVIKRNGVVIDYQMNKACAAGTGSFIDELAEQLGVRVHNGEFARLAFEAPHTIDLGSRCAAFMGQSVASAQQAGVPIEVVAASLSNSIAANYLSKVLGNRKLGDRVILTGAVFYNDAVVSAFKSALEGKTVSVSGHKEVTGAIGAALLAREEMAGRPSKFKGFQKVIDSEHKLSTFTCKKCDNNCTITRMEIPGESPTFYGSRCDLFDSTVSRGRVSTPFDEREALLYGEYREGTGNGPVVGLPRALMVYDYAPMLIGFLNALGARAVLSNKTNNQIMHQSVELSYSDSCFPMKLVHGHAESLKEQVDYLLFPSVLRMGLKEGDENQKYACPLVQASPFIIRQALGLGRKLLVPMIDFSHGDEDVIESLARVAQKIGYSKQQGVDAANAALTAQRDFERAQAEVGRRTMANLLSDPDQLGVVIFARSYMSQDSGANLGVAEKLAQLGVTPIPLDFLPLDSVDVREYSDRPYWFNEAKHIAGAAVVASDPRLFGLVITNFGCGPNSFVLNVVEDIMGEKPLGQLEIDEHAAEAGLVTRLEAFVDTIRQYAAAGRTADAGLDGRDIRRYAYTRFNESQTVLLPRMCEHAEVLAAAMQAYGVDAQVLPEPDYRNLLYANRVTSGKECLPYRVTLGGFMRYLNEENAGDRANVEGFLAAAFGPCRFGKYAVEQIRILHELGYDFPIRTTVSNNGYHDWNLGSGFERLAWRGIVGVDHLERLLWRARPYEKTEGSAKALFDDYLVRLADLTRKRESIAPLLKDAAQKFMSLIDPGLARRPLVGINGEIFLRSNSFSNSNLVLECEKAGLEVVVSPMSEWFKYVTHRNIEDGVRDRDVGRILKGYLRKLILTWDEHRVASIFNGSVEGKEPSTKALLTLSGKYLSPMCGSEAVLSIGAGLEWLEESRFAGVISVMPHGCMPGGIVAAIAEQLATQYGKPWISLTYDGILESNNQARIVNFAEVIKFTSREGARG